MNGHEIIHRLLYLHRVIKETLADIPATPELSVFRQEALNLKMAIEHKVIVKPEEILNVKEE